jgi:hypothetical protein
MTRSHASPRAEAELATDDSQRPASPSPALAGSRLAYRPPRLECHGRLSEVTRFGGSQVVDSGAGLGQQV